MNGGSNMWTRECEEDEACWNWETMGNMMRGSDSKYGLVRSTHGGMWAL